MGSRGHVFQDREFGMVNERTEAFRGHSDAVVPVSARTVCRYPHAIRTCCRLAPKFARHAWHLVDVILPVNRQAAADRAIAHQRSEVAPHLAGVDGGINFRIAKYSSSS